MTLRYTDIDPNVIELITRKLQTPLENLIEEKIQRRQQWGPTFKQEDIAELAMTDADLVVPAPEYGKRIFRFGGALTAPRVVRVPPIPSAWWIVHNRTSQPLTFLTDPAGTIGPTITADALGGIYTDGVGVWQFACCGEAVEGGEEMPPGGAGTNIQYRLSATTFGGVGGSSVNGASGQNVVWEGSHTMSKAGNQSQEIVLDPNGAQTLMVARQYSDANTPFTFVVQRARGSYITAAPLADGDFVSYFSFRGQLAGGMTQLGYITTTFISDIDSLGDGGVLTLGARAASEARIEIGQGTHPTAGETAYVEMFAGAHYFQVQTNGLVLSAGEPGSIFFIGPDMAGTSYLLDLDIGAEGDVLKVVGGFPAWGAVAGASYPSLDQVVDPGAAKDFGMANHTLGFTFTAAESENNFVIRSIANAVGASNSAVLSVETPGASNTKMPFMVSARGFPFFNVYADGNVGVRTAANPGAHFQVSGNTRLITGGTDPGLRTLDVSSVATVPRGAASFYAQDGGALSIVYTNVDIATNASFSGAGTEVRGMWSRMQYSGTLANPKLRGVTSSFDPIGASISSGGGFTAFYAPAHLSGTPSLNGRYTGLYLAHPVNPWISGKYGVITEPGLVNGFGFDAGGSPGATVHVNGTVRFDLGSDARGDIYYRAETTGLLTRLPATVGGAGLVLTLQDQGGGALEPRWMTAGGGPGGGTPGTPVGGLQYNLAGTGFGGMTNSAVSGTGGVNLTLGGTFTVRNAASNDKTFAVDTTTTTHTTVTVAQYSGTLADDPPIFRFQRARGTGSTDIISGDYVGRISFEGRLSGIQTRIGYLHAVYDAASSGTYMIAMGSGTTARLEVTDTGVGIGAVTMYAGAHHLQVQSTGFVISAGTPGSLLFKGTNPSIGYLYDLPIDQVNDEGKVLTATEVTDENGTFLLPRWVAPTGGPGGGTPGGIANGNLQYRLSPTSFGGLYYSWVENNTDIVMGGSLNVTAGGAAYADQNFFMSAKSNLAARMSMTTWRTDLEPMYIQFNRGYGSDASKGNIVASTPIGEFRFQGWFGGPLHTQLAYLRGTYLSAGLGGQIEIGTGASAGNGCRVTVIQNAGVQLAEAISANTHTLSVFNTGFFFSHGQQGAIYYKAVGTSPSPTTNGAFVPLETTGASAGYVLTLQTVSGVLLPRWVVASGGPGGGIPSTGGSVNAIQYSTGTTSLGGINTALGVLIATGSGIVAGFGTNFPASRFTFSATTTAGLNVGTASSDPTAGNSINGDVYYNNSTGKFRGRQNSVWTDLISTGGSVTPPVTFTYTNTTTSDLSTLLVDHSIQTSGTITNTYGMKMWFRHKHTGGMFNSTSQRVGFALGWDHTTSGTGGNSNKGDSVFQIYAQNTAGMSTLSYRLTGIMIESDFPSIVGEFTGIRLKGANAVNRRAIMVENGAGDVMINAPAAGSAGTELSTTATYGFLYIPSCNGVPSGSLSGIVPTGTCALCYNSAANQLYANDGGGWVLV